MKTWMTARAVWASLLVLPVVCLPSELAAQTPSGWASRDIGSPALAGSASHASGTYTITAAGQDIWGSSDQFHFAYLQMSGNVEIVARARSLTYTDPWAKAGVMIRESLNADSRHAMLVTTAANGYAFQRRLQPGGSSSHTVAGNGDMPVWVRLVRTGNLFEAYRSADGSSWTRVGSETISMSETIHVGLAVTSHDEAAVTTSIFDNVRLNGAASGGGLPAGQQALDIGAPVVTGSATFSSGTYTIAGAGRDIWDTADQFHFVYQAVTGNTDVIARVGSLQYTDAWAKAGVMIRESLAADARHAMMVVTPESGDSFQRRRDKGGVSYHTTVGSGAAPGWVRLVRSGDSVEAFRSSDGAHWTQIGTDTVAMGETVYVGLAVTSHNESVATRAVFDNLTITAAYATAPPEHPAPPPPSGAAIYGTVDPAVLGGCSAAVHDFYVVDGGDGYLYRTWHPQRDQSGCTFAHEHGDDPTSIRHAGIAAEPVLFGYIGRRHSTHDEPHGHDEPHEGFKVFVANPGDVNDEGRINRVYSRSVFHMGSGGPRRFATRFHSADIKLVHPEYDLVAHTQLMMDTGGVGTVCNPRMPAPVKDIVSLGSSCKLNSFYEIWTTTGVVKYNGREVYRVFATPAIFDPLTVFNPANPGEVVYAWDSRVNTLLNFPTTSRASFRGCDRESYAQPGYWYNGGYLDTGRTVFYTDAMGNQVDATHPMALEQVISRHYSIGVPATHDGLVQFKVRRSYCGSGLGFKN